MTALAIDYVEVARETMRMAQLEGYLAGERIKKIIKEERERAVMELRRSR